MKMPSTEYAKRFQGKSRDTFHLTRETETIMLECIYTARIEALKVDDWTRVRTAHSNHGDLVSYVSFNKKKKKKK